MRKFYDFKSLLGSSKPKTTATPDLDLEKIEPLDPGSVSRS